MSLEEHKNNNDPTDARTCVSADSEQDGKSVDDLEFYNNDRWQEYGVKSSSLDSFEHAEREHDDVAAAEDEEHDDEFCDAQQTSCDHSQEQEHITHDNDDHDEDEDQDEKYLQAIAASDSISESPEKITAAASINSGLPSSPDVLQTIQAMENDGGLMHPVHGHSFQAVNFMMLSLYRKCAGCQARLGMVFGGTSSSSSSSSDSTESSAVVKCVACGALAHRSCAFPTGSNQKVMWTEKCSGNAAAAAAATAKVIETAAAAAKVTDEESKVEKGDEPRGHDKSGELVEPTSKSVEIPATGDVVVAAAAAQDEEEQDPYYATEQVDVGSSEDYHDVDNDDDQSSAAMSEPQEIQHLTLEDLGDFLSVLEWTDQGPPKHWAPPTESPETPPFVIPTYVTTTTAAAENAASSAQAETENQHESLSSPREEVPLHYANHPFASVSQALQENIVAHFQRERSQDISLDDPGNASSMDATNHPGSSLEESSPLKQQQQSHPQSPPKTPAAEAIHEPSPGTDEPNKSAQQIPETENAEQDQHPLVKFASGTYQVVQNRLSGKYGVATVAGGIAGGMAGLAMAGPAGAMAGFRFGQAAGALSVVLEGSVSIGVMVASVATATYTAEKIQESIMEGDFGKQTQRILTMGENGTSRKVLLVRPNIEIDPIWESIVKDARDKAPKEPTTGRAFAMPRLLPPASPEAAEARRARARYRRQEDIINSDESEIPTPQKVLLLVSRILTDKSSLPGYIYRYLIQTFKDRCKQREQLQDVIKSDSEAVPLPSSSTPDDHAPDKIKADSGALRARREDAHAVIKHVTACLLEVQPGLSSSPMLTELTASAVESLVFVELYLPVIEEIAQECEARDTALRIKIEAYNASLKAKGGPAAGIQRSVSRDALEALCMLPNAHSAVEKLQHCVNFLERISQAHFEGTNKLMGADSLLKLVCQHILAVRCDHLNAQVAFLEEFARDEQLLRGREGYALVTLQAALHFLNMSTDIEVDIFGQDDDEENVPVASPTASSTILAAESDPVETLATDSNR